MVKGSRNDLKKVKNKSENKSEKCFKIVVFTFDKY